MITCASACRCLAASERTNASVSRAWASIRSVILAPSQAVRRPSRIAPVTSSTISKPRPRAHISMVCSGITTNIAADHPAAPAFDRNRALARGAWCRAGRAGIPATTPTPDSATAHGDPVLASVAAISGVTPCRRSPGTLPRRLPSPRAPSYSSPTSLHASGGHPATARPAAGLQHRGDGADQRLLRNCYSGHRKPCVANIYRA